MQNNALEINRYSNSPQLFMTGSKPQQWRQMHAKKPDMKRIVKQQ